MSWDSSCGRQRVHLTFLLRVSCLVLSCQGIPVKRVAVVSDDMEAITDEVGVTRLGTTVLQTLCPRLFQYQVERCYCTQMLSPPLRLQLAHASCPQRAGDTHSTGTW